MALQRAVYRPRVAEHTVLHQVGAEHLPSWARRRRLATGRASRSSSSASSDDINLEMSEFNGKGSGTIRCGPQQTAIR